MATHEQELAELNDLYQLTQERMEQLEAMLLKARELLIVCADVLAHDVEGGAPGLRSQITAWRTEAVTMIGEE